MDKMAGPQVARIILSSQLCPPPLVVSHLTMLFQTKADLNF